MEKTELANSLKELRRRLAELRKEADKSKQKQIFTKGPLQEAESIATVWFDELEAPLRNFYQVDPLVVDRFHEMFGRLLHLSTTNPVGSTLMTLIAEIEKPINGDLLLPVLKHQTEIKKYGYLDKIVANKRGVELDYLSEAVKCADSGFFRAAIILGWAAAVDRLHQVIVRDGLDKFNIATESMTALTTGRYKRFNKKFQIYNLSDLRMSVFDNDLLWILEFLGKIDGNEHERLGITFTLRNTCAHPGEATISPENVASFFSDLESLVFNNPKFKVE